MSTASGSSFVRKELIDRIDELYCKNEAKGMFGELCDGRLRMPIRDADGRKATWHRKLNAIARKITNSVKSRDDCWLMSLPAGESYPDVKISKDGSRSKWKVHRFLRCVIRPDEISCVEGLESAKDNLQLAHLCGNGMNASGLNTACVNPYHTAWVTAKVNIDQKGCTYGVGFRCKHDPKCIFCDRETGRYLPCVNAVTPTVCSCKDRCY